MRQLQLLRDFKRLIPILLGSVAGILILFDRLFANISGISEASQQVLELAQFLAAFAVLVGVANVVWFHLGRLRRRHPRWPYSVALLIGVLIPPGLALYSNFAEAQPIVLETSLFQDVVRWVYTPLSVSLLALLTFFALTAAIRALGSGSREAVVVTVVATFMLLLQLPITAWLPFVGETAVWIQQYLALAGLRGLALGAAIGAVVASVRIILGLDRPYLDR